MEIGDEDVQTVLQEIRKGLIGGRPKGSGKRIHSQGMNGDVNAQMSEEESNFTPSNNLWIDSYSDKEYGVRYLDFNSEQDMQDPTFKDGSRLELSSVGTKGEKRLELNHK
ncbi:hypothetical protein GH714_010638 [Hevea brasiliensis]|uniref:Uncharacterized protein n=1 Tax=Hevea brasiliensis TaxID=3981 RepID=A0A6A6NAG3_HEVBR|nr:hypothetical protein GH714_010638 [Hevea brasiliensis]